jgi:DNA-directed RNA polymerase subunit RPC12/RpoP
MTYKRTKFTYKYICLECQEATMFSPKERIAKGGMRCSACGSRLLEPSNASNARHNMPIHHDLKETWNEKYERQRSNENPTN